MSAPLVTLKFMDGPATGMTREVPRGTKQFRLGPFLYTLAGRLGTTLLMCRQPKSRVARAALARIGAGRKDPRLLAVEWKQKPVRGTSSVVGRGAAKRRARAEAKA